MAGGVAILDGLAKTAQDARNTAAIVVGNDHDTFEETVLHGGCRQFARNAADVFLTLDVGVDDTEVLYDNVAFHDVEESRTGVGVIDVQSADHVIAAVKVAL